MKSITRLVFVAIVSGVVTGTFACSLIGDSWQPPTVVKIQSEKEVAALMPSWAMWHSVAEAGEPQGLLLRDGDYLIADAMVRYRASDGRSLAMSYTDWSAKIGDTTVALELHKDKPDAGAWLKGATDRQLADLRTLGVVDLDSDLLPAIKRLAGANPHVDLSFENSASLIQVLPLFQPRAVFVSEEVDEAALKTIASQKQIEMLMLTAKEAGSLNVLTSLPALRSLVLDNWDVTKAGPLPNGLASLRSLLVLNLDHPESITDLKPLTTVAPYLEELSIIGAADQFTNLAGIEKMTRLRTFVVWGGELGDVSPLAALADLRWVGLPPKTTQEQFAAFVAAHPKLTILDLSRNETVKDLTPLTTLRDLQGLILGGAAEDISVVPKLTTLKFVGVSKDAWDAAPDQVAAIKKALPDALVVKVSSCLGSGWILLLLPVPIVAWLIRRRRRGLAAAQAA
jgi:hypothetical protein